MKSSPLESLLLEYLDYLEIEKNRSPKTRMVYERYLKTFLRQSGMREVKELTEDAIRQFRLWLARNESGGKGTTRAKSTQAYYVIAIRSFLKYLAKRDIRTVSPDKIELPKVPQRQLEVLEYADLERLLSAPKGGTIRDLRDKAILETFFSTGLRISELCSLDRYIDLERGEVTVRGKGEKLRVVFFSEDARGAIKRYIKARTDAEAALFLSYTRQGKPLDRIIPRAVERMMDSRAKAAGVAHKIHPHQLRHSYATDLLINGADLRSVQSLLGHASVSTTQIYTHLTNKELRDVHEAFHGRRRGR